MYNSRYIGCIPKSEAIFLSYFLRIVYIWNYLPVDLKSMDMEDEEANTKFKKAVREYYMNKFDMSCNVESVCTWISKCRCLACRM